VAVIPAADNMWGVSVEEVSALAPHVTIGEAPIVPVDDTFHIPADRKISVNEVEQFIRDVAGRVSLRLSDMGRITDTARLSAVRSAAHDAVVNGAASYLVSAAYPIGGQVNADGGYAALLWSRFETVLGNVGTILDGWLSELPATTPLAEGGAAGYSFPAAMFPDGVRY